MWTGTDSDCHTGKTQEFLNFYFKSATGKQPQSSLKLVIALVDGDVIETKDDL